MVSQFVLKKDSALSWNVKKAALSGEVARRLLNTSPVLVSEGLAEEQLDKFCYKLMVSGYNQREREIILKEGNARYRNLCELVEKGVRPLYRSASWKKEERSNEKLLKKKNWYGNNDAVMFVQATPGSILKKEVELIMKAEGMKVSVVEKGGKNVQQLLQKSDIDPNKFCNGSECAVCTTSGRGSCWKEGVCYIITCLECRDEGKQSRMFGETGKTGRIRCNQHLKAYMNEKNSNLWEHACKFHNRRKDVNFMYEVSSVHTRDPLGRQLTEALSIEAAGLNEYSMNDKDEWVRPSGLRINVERM